MPTGHEFSAINQPLDADERETVLKAAIESRAAVSVSTLLLLYSGIRPYWAAHVTNDLVSETDAGLTISLPPGRHECKAGGHGGLNNNWGANNGSCHHCEGRDGVLGENGLFEFPNPRTVPVRHPDAVDVILSWFDIYDSLPSVARQRYFVRELGDQVDIPRLSPIVLRHSYGVLLASKGFSRKEVQEVMGFAESSYEGGYVFMTYGDLCEGPNPYVCGAETRDGGRCQKPVKGNRNRCTIHDDSTCGAPTDQEGQCTKYPSEPDGRCHWHTET